MSSAGMVEEVLAGIIGIARGLLPDGLVRIFPARDTGDTRGSDVLVGGAMGENVSVESGQRGQSALSILFL